MTNMDDKKKAALKKAALVAAAHKAAKSKANKEMVMWHKRHCGHRSVNPFVTAGVLVAGVVLGAVLTKYVLKVEDEPEKDEGFSQLNSSVDSSRP